MRHSIKTTDIDQLYRMLWLIWVLWVTRWSLNGSDLFQCITWILDQIEIWGVLGPDLHFELFVMFFEPFQKVLKVWQCVLSSWGRPQLSGSALAMRVCTAVVFTVGGWYVSKNNHMNARTQDFPPEHCTVQH